MYRSVERVLLGMSEVVLHLIQRHVHIEVVFQQAARLLILILHTTVLTILAQVNFLVKHLTEIRTGTVLDCLQFLEVCLFSLLSPTLNFIRLYNHIDSRLADVNGFSPETNNYLPARSVANSTSVDTSSGYHHGVIENRNPTFSHGFPGNSSQAASSSRFSHRSTPTYRSSSNGLRLGHVASSSGDRSHMADEAYPSRHIRAPPHISWRSGDRTGRRRSSYERFQPPFHETALHERFSSEVQFIFFFFLQRHLFGVDRNFVFSCILNRFLLRLCGYAKKQGFMVVDRQQHYGSRNMLDHHRELRLDIDDMTYEVNY